MVQQVASPCVLVEMGSGNSEKSRIFIDAILERQSTLQYIPVDISKGKTIFNWDGARQNQQKYLVGQQILRTSLGTPSLVRVWRKLGVLSYP